MKIIILDVETTGQEDGDIIQIAIYNPGKDSFVSNVKPTKKILPSATVVHGITNEEAATFPELSIVNSNLRSYIKQNMDPVSIVVGHNISFDCNMIQKDFRIFPKKMIDTLRMARKLLIQQEIGNYKLDSVYYYLFPDKLKHLKEVRLSHNALEDCKLTHDVLHGLINIGVSRNSFINDYEQIMAWVNEPMLVENWPFGKYKGQPLNVDVKYAKWYLEKAENKNPDIVWSLTKLIK